jgi:ribosomal protein S21
VANVKRRKGESFESLMRRFGRRIQQSGKILEARKLRFFAEKPSKNKQKASALRRMEIKEKREYQMKIGQLVEDRRRNHRRR